MPKEKGRPKTSAWMDQDDLVSRMGKFTFSEFIDGKWSWDDYIDQFERMCRVKGLGEDSSREEEHYVGPKELRSIKNYFVSENIDERTYEEVKTTFKNIFKPEVTIFAARIAFKRTIRLEGESFVLFGAKHSM